MVGGEIGGGCAGVGGGKRRFAACRVSCGLWAARNACGVGRGGVGGHAALCGLPRFLRPSGRSQRLRGGALGRGGHAAFCNLPRFLRPLGRSQRLRRAGWGAGGVGGMPRFATCRVSCGLWAARNACGGWGALGRGGHAALCNLSRFLRPLGRSQRLLFCAALGREGHAAFCNLPRFLRPLGRSQRLRLLCCGTGSWGAAPNPGKGLRPLHPALLSPYLTTLLLSLRISSVTPSGGSPNVALSVLLPPSHVSCIAISRASIRQPSSTTVTTSPTS